MLLINKLVTPMLVSVTAFEALVVPTNWGAKPRMPERVKMPVKETRGPVTKPVPLRAAVCGLIPALSVTVSRPVCKLPRVGLKVTLMVQDAAGAIVTGQLFV